MSIPAKFEKELAAFPIELRNLVKAELAAGNRIVEIGSGFPAPPVGACLKLAKLVSTRPRETAKGLDFYERNLPGYSGEFTDDQRFYFVLEPALPPPPPPDMDAIRAAKEEKQRAADAELYREQAKKVNRSKKTARSQKSSREPTPAPSPSPRQPVSEMDAIRAALNAREHAANCERFPDMTERDYSSEPHLRAAAPSPLPPLTTPAERAVREKLNSDPNSVLARFKASMEINYDKWHDGIGYDLALIKQANPEELKAIEDLLLQRRNSDWRDVEALAALNSPRAKQALKEAFKLGDTHVRMAVHSHAPTLMTESERTASLVQALEQGDNYSGLTQALLEVETFHPPQIMTALLRGLMDRDGGTACHFAAMLYFLHGKSASAFDWNHRPFFLRFNTPDLVEREKAVRELCATIGADPSRCIKPKPAQPTLTSKKPKTGRRPKP